MFRQDLTLHGFPGFHPRFQIGFGDKRVQSFEPGRISEDFRSRIGVGS